MQCRTTQCRTTEIVAHVNICIGLQQHCNDGRVLVASGGVQWNGAMNITCAQVRTCLQQGSDDERVRARRTERRVVTCAVWRYAGRLVEDRFHSTVRLYGTTRCVKDRCVREPHPRAEPVNATGGPVGAAVNGGQTLLDRELSWVEFNRRVLDQALRPEVPLLERLRFLTIVSSNFDEFFMVRAAALKRSLSVTAGDRQRFARLGGGGARGGRVAIPARCTRRSCRNCRLPESGSSPPPR